MVVEVEHAVKRISLPFRFGTDGEVAHTTSPPQIIADEIKTAVLTAYGQRVMEPTVGAAVSDWVFGPQTSQTDLDYGDELMEEVNAQLSMGRVRSITTRYGRVEPTAMSIDITFTISTADETNEPLLESSVDI